MTDIQISLATTADTPQLCELLNHLFSQEQEFIPNHHTQSRALIQIIENPHIGQIFVARQNTHIIGMISLLYSVSTALGGKVALLEDMVMLPEFRNSGIGTKLLKHTIEFARENNCLRITLLTDDSNKSAQRFYQRQSFVRSEMITMRLLL